MVDLSFLEKFTKSDPVKMKRYIGMYLKVAPQTFQQMEQNLNDQDWEQLRINAHSLKPQTDYMGIESLKEVLVEMETRLKNDQTNGMEALYQNALNLHLESEKLLRTYLEEKPES